MKQFRFLTLLFYIKFAQASGYSYATAAMGASFNFINLHGRHWTPLPNITIQIRRGSCTLAYFMGAFMTIFSYSGGLQCVLGWGGHLRLFFETLREEGRQWQVALSSLLARFSFYLPGCSQYLLSKMGQGMDGWILERVRAQCALITC
jgi:hypothetical protein